MVQGIKYAPRGSRGYASSHRAGGYTFLNPAEYVRLSNEHTLTVCYCETGDAVNNVDEIAAVDEVDVIFLGPWDLSQSIGLIGQLDHPELRRQIDHVIERTRAAGKAAGIIASDADEAQRWFDQGVQYVTISSDLGMLATLSRKIVGQLKK